MVDPFFGSVLGAAGNLIGGLVSGESSRKANENARDQAAHQMQQQKDFAQHGIKWRADDVMGAYAKTGIHPLALLGVQGPTYSPVTSVFNTSPMGDAIGRAGQDISRGIHATADRELREEALKVQQIALKNAAVRGGLENELLTLQIENARQKLTQTSNPPMPSANQKWVIPGSVPGGAFEPKTVAGVGHLRMPDGTIMPVKSKDAADRMDEDWFGNLKHFLVRTVGPMLYPNEWSRGYKQPGPNDQWRYKSDWKGDLYKAPLDRGYFRSGGRVHHGSERR